MTIHSDWARVFRAECPEAFCETLPQEPFDVGIIDGHLQLMSLHSGFGSWDLFLTAVFLRPIEHMFERGQCNTVVLCFDSYDNVPLYKAMTQHKRVQHVGSVAIFEADQELPKQIPDDAMPYLMNRNFKLKIIQLACARIPQMVNAKMSMTAQYRDKRFILDYKSAVEYRLGDSMVPLTLTDMVPLGESDIKFCRYVQKYGNALVHAIDGDYMAIALLYFAIHGIHENNRVFLLRQASRFATSNGDWGEQEEDNDENEENIHKKGKRKQNSITCDTKKGARKKTKKTPKCWVDMQLLFAVLARAVRQGISSKLSFSSSSSLSHPQMITDGEMVCSAVFLILCAGTDFSRPLPLLGPRRLWEHLPIIAVGLVKSVRLISHSDIQPNYQLLEDKVVAPIYKAIFSKHVSGASATLNEILTQLQHAPKLSNSTTSRIPNLSQVQTTMLNIAWVQRYWMAHNHKVPTPLDGSNGYVQCPQTQRVVFLDYQTTLSTT